MSIEYQQYAEARRKALEAMSLKDAQVELSNNLYEAARIIEELEYTKNSKGDKKVQGNGHHIRQRIAAFGEELLAERWRE